MDFHCTYDATGNHLTEVTTGGLPIAFVYDNAYLLTSVCGIPLPWDNNGILLSDGSSTGEPLSPRAGRFGDVPNAA